MIVKASWSTGRRETTAHFALLVKYWWSTATCSIITCMLCWFKINVWTKYWVQFNYELELDGDSHGQTDRRTHARTHTHTHTHWHTHTHRAHARTHTHTHTDTHTHCWLQLYCVDHIRRICARFLLIIMWQQINPPGSLFLSKSHCTW